MVQLWKLPPELVVARFTRKGPVLIEDIVPQAVDVEVLDSDQCVHHTSVPGVVLE